MLTMIPKDFWRKPFVIVMVFFMVYLSGCKGADGPAGPKLKGTLLGFIILNDLTGTRQADLSGVTVSGAGVTATTDVDGKFALNDVETGTYEIVSSKSGYGSYKAQGVSFASGGTAYLGTITLGQIPTSSPIPTIQGSSTQNVSVTVTGTLSAAATSVQYYVMYLGKTNTIDPLNPSTYISNTTTVVSQGGTTFNVTWSVATLRSLGIINSTTPNLSFVCYPYNTFCNSYTDIFTNRRVYPAITTTGSTTISVQTP